MTTVAEIIRCTVNDLGSQNAALRYCEAVARQNGEYAALYAQAADELRDAISSCVPINANPSESPKEFPIFHSHAAVRCFHCNELVRAQAQQSGQPPGRGAFFQTCTCGFLTWYDLTTETRANHCGRGFDRDYGGTFDGFRVTSDADSSL